MEIIFRVHAIQRMFESSVTAVDNVMCLPMAKPLKTTPMIHLILAVWYWVSWIGANRPLHVVVADHVEEYSMDCCYSIRTCPCSLGSEF